MVRQFYESPMNRIRSELDQRIPKEYWPRINISREEISDLLFFHNDASLKEIASFLSIDISDERASYPGRDSISINAIDIYTRDVVETFGSITAVYKKLLIRMGSPTQYNTMSKIIDEQFAFSLYGRYVILSYTPYIVGEMNPILYHSFNLARFRKFLYDMGYDFINEKTSVVTLRKRLGFSKYTSLKTMMEFYFLEWSKKKVCGFNRSVLVHIVTPTTVSEPMSLSGVGVTI